MDLDVKVPQVIFVRHGADSGDSTQKKNRQRLGQDLDSGRQLDGGAHGSAIRRSVSFTMRFGRAILE